MQHGVMEHINWSIQERVTTMLQHSELNLGFWAEALQTTIYLINLSPSKEIRLEVLHALWSGKEPAYDRFRIFGCEAYAFIPREKRTKLSPHATKCIFLGYGTNGEFGYRLWDPKNRTSIRSSDVVFNEDSILSRNQQKIVGQNVSVEITTDGVEGPAHRTELTLRQRTEENEVPTNRDTKNGALGELEDKTIKHKAESTHIKKGKDARNVRVDLTDTRRAKGKS